MSIRTVLRARVILALLAILSIPDAFGETGETLPLVVPLDRVLTAPQALWRQPSLEIYRWELFPDIIILDMVDFASQDRMFTRLAYFLEKRGFRGSLLRNTQLAGRHGWNAHDYGPAGLASFFNAAQGSQFPLNVEELSLRTLATEQGILLVAGGRFRPGKGGILALSRSSSPIERRYLLTHESYHGVFFSSQEYRDFCFKLWDSLAPAERDFYTSFLDSLGYDTADEYLVVNEFQAYLMQQPLDAAAAYFERFMKIFSQNGTGEPLDPARLLASARSLDAFLQSRFEIRAGRTLLVQTGTETGR